MEQPDELFQLIKALTKSEKKFFTQYVNIYEKSGTPIYLKLFEFINELEEYDEDKIFKKFRDTNFRKNYPVTKHYLKNLIIKTLRHAEITVREERDLSVYILDVKRLMVKGLFSMAKKQIEKLKDETYAEEKFNDLIQLIAMQRSLITLGYYKHEPAITLDTLDLEEELLLQKMKELRQVMNAALKLYSLMHYEASSVPNETLKQIQALGQLPVLQNEDELQSAKARHTFLQFWAQYNCATGNFEQYASYAKRKLDFVTAIKAPSSAVVNWQILAHNHCMAAEMMIKDFTGIKSHLQFLEELKLQSPMHEAERFQTLALYGTLYYIKNYDEQKLTYYINYALEGLKTYNPYVRKFFVYTLRTIVAYGYLKLKKLDECWAEVNELTALTNGESRKDFVGHVKIINLMLRFEMKEYNYVAYLLKNTYRYFIHYLFSSPVHKLMISYMKEALKTSDEKTLKALNLNYQLILDRIPVNPNEAEMALVMMAEDYFTK